MPIPTRTSPVKSHSDPRSTARSVSQGKTVTNRGAVEQDDRRQIPGSSATSAAVKSTAAQSRTLPKAAAAARNTSSIVRHGRTPSTNITSSRSAPVRVATESSSRASSTSSSSVSYSTGATSLTANTKPRAATTTRTTENSRSVSNGTSGTATGKSIPSQPSRLKSTSTLQPRPQPSRTVKDNPSTTTLSRIKQPSGTIKVEPKVKPQQSANRNTSISSSTSAAIPTPSSHNTLRLQDEVYQLQLTHAQSFSTLNQYKQSVETTLHNKRAHLQAQQTDLLALESQIQEAKSTDALHKWLYPNRSSTQSQIQTRPNNNTIASNEQNAAIQRIQNLSTQISTLDALHTSDALAPLIHFESWLETALSIHQHRLSHTDPNGNGHNLQSNDLELVASLGHPWKAQMRSLQARLQSVVAGLHDLRDTSLSSTSSTTTTATRRGGLAVEDENKGEDEDQDTGIATILSRYTRLAETLLHEVEVAVVVERAVMAAEAEWEEQKVQEALMDLGLRDGNGDNVNPVQGDRDGSGDADRVYPGIWATWVGK